MPSILNQELISHSHMLPFSTWLLFQSIPQKACCLFCKLITIPATCIRHLLLLSICTSQRISEFSPVIPVPKLPLVTYSWERGKIKYPAWFEQLQHLLCQKNTKIDTWWNKTKKNSINFDEIPRHYNQFSSFVLLLYCHTMSGTFFNTQSNILITCICILPSVSLKT